VKVKNAADLVRAWGLLGGAGRHAEPDRLAKRHPDRQRGKDEAKVWASSAAACKDRGPSTSIRACRMGRPGHRQAAL